MKILRIRKLIYLRITKLGSESKSVLTPKPTLFPFVTPYCPTLPHGLMLPQFGMW